MKKTNSASEYFNYNWGKYQQTILNNTLYHTEMMNTLDVFLDSQRGAQPFDLVDVGCGDASTISEILGRHLFSHYIGIDAASDVLKLAQTNLSKLDCEKKFICGNMLEVVSELNISADIIFTSYAVHHLSSQQKIDFIELCQHRLKSNGFLIIIDIVLRPNQTRAQWLLELGNRMQQTQSLTDDELIERMIHPTADDFPEEIATFATIAKQQNWARFEILFEREVFAFMVFTK